MTPPAQPERYLPISSCEDCPHTEFVHGLLFKCDLTGIQIKEDWSFPEWCPLSSRPAPQQPDCENCRKVYHLTQNLKTALEMAKQPPAPADAVLDELEAWLTEKVEPAEALDRLLHIQEKIAALRVREVQHGKNIPMVDRGAPDRYTSVSLEEWERMQRGEQHG